MILLITLLLTLNPQDTTKVKRKPPVSDCGGMVPRMMQIDTLSIDKTNISKCKTTKSCCQKKGK